ncbi:MAG: hypothetical protein KDK70_22915 [Myxococcales bacterium]|nr:hypothetical protein [Myxococcales bacterium]
MLPMVVWAGLAGSVAQAPVEPQVAVISPTGGERLPALESAIVEALEGKDLVTTRLRLGARDASGCTDSMVAPACVERLRRGWGQRPSLVVVGSISAEAGAPRAQVLVLHRDEPEPVARFDARFVEGDLVLPIVFPLAVAEAVDQHLYPPDAPTAEELHVLSTLDEPPGEPEAPRAAVSVADPPSPAPESRPPLRVALGSSPIDETLHLRRDFDQVCRRGPRRRRASRDDPRDLRPRCGLGPTLGYVRPRTWVMASLAIASGVASGVAFAVQDDASRGAAARREAGAWGTAAAATSVVLGVGTVTSMVADRWQARRYLQNERWLAAQ